MNQTRSTYQVHAEILRTDQATEDFDDAQAGHPMERRLHRLERVAAAYRGRIDLRFNSVMLISFETADAALLGACEMQHRCAVLPNVSKQTLSLRIGIHQTLIRQRSKDNSDNSREIASQLAVLDDGIVLSDLVVAELNPDLRKITRPLPDSPIGITAYRADWRSEIPATAYGGESFWPATMESRIEGTFLRLHYGMKTLELTHSNPLITIGRDPLCDLVLAGIHVSRNHCQITLQAERIVLTDSSTNGTSVTSKDGKELLVRKNSLTLRGKGLLFFGRPYNGERRGGAKFESY